MNIKCVTEENWITNLKEELKRMNKIKNQLS